MKYLAALVLSLAATGANAQGFVDEPTCYSWNGGHKSAGSFSKCSPPMVVAKAPAPPPPTPVVAAPVLQAAPVCPPQITVIPEPKRKPIVKRKPAPLKC